MDRKSIFEIMNKNVDYIYEYSKLYNMITNDEIYMNYRTIYNLESFVDEYIEKWEYRDTCTSFKDLLKRLGLKSKTTKDNVFNDLLNLIELCLNLGLFLKKVAKKEFAQAGSMMIDFEQEAWINDTSDMPNSILFENCIKLLDKMGYISYKKGELILIKRKDIDTITTIIETNNNEITDLLLEYIDFRNEKNLEIKKRILNDISFKLNPIRKDIPNREIENTLFEMFNNLNIRHNNNEGKDKKEFASSLTTEEQLAWYDKTFALALTAIRLVEFKNNKKIYEKIHDQNV